QVFKGAGRLLDAVCRREPGAGHRGRVSGTRTPDFGLQLREKQKLKRMYGVLEKQFRRYFAEADRRRGNTGEILIELLESRLDNVVYRMGFGSTRAEARQLVTHRAIEVNGQRADIPSVFVKPGDVISIRERSRSQVRIQEALELAEEAGLPQWVEVDAKKYSGVYKQHPDRTDVAHDVNESLVVELYSR